MSAYDDLKAEIAAEKAQVMAGIDGLKAQIVALEEQLASGGHITAEQLADLKNDVTNIFTPPQP